MTTLGWLITHTIVATVFLLIGHKIAETKANQDEKERIENEKFTK
jgi:hypothetical protein